MLVVPALVAGLGVGTAVGLGWLAVLSLGVAVSRDRSKGSDARYARTMASSLVVGMLFMLVALPIRTLTRRDVSRRDTSEHDTAGV